MALAIIGMVFGTILVAYTQATKRAQWSGMSLAAQALAIQQIEQIRSARWDLPGVVTPIDEITNVFYSTGNVASGSSWTILDLPYSGTNYIVATNRVTITRTNWVSETGTVLPNVYIRMVQVDTIWPFTWGKTRYYTNTVVTYCSPDN